MTQDAIQEAIDCLKYNLGILTGNMDGEMAPQGYNHIDAMRKALTALKKYQEGFPIEDAPKDGTEFIVLENDTIQHACYDKHKRLCYKTYNSLPDGRVFCDWDLMCRFRITPNPTRWWPIPKGKDNG